MMRHWCGGRFLRVETHCNADEITPAHLRNWHVRGRISRMIELPILGCHKVARTGVFGFTFVNAGATICLL
jgi:hypothetical protein